MWQLFDEKNYLQNAFNMLDIKKHIKNCYTLAKSLRNFSDFIPDYYVVQFCLEKNYGLLFEKIIRENENVNFLKQIVHTVYQLVAANKVFVINEKKKM